RLRRQPGAARRQGRWPTARRTGRSGWQGWQWSTLVPFPSRRSGACRPAIAWDRVAGQADPPGHVEGHLAVGSDVRPEQRGDGPLVLGGELEAAVGEYVLDKERVQV